MAKVANMMTGDKLFRIGFPTPNVKVLKTKSTKSKVKSEVDRRGRIK